MKDASLRGVVKSPGTSVASRITIVIGSIGSCAHRAPLLLFTFSDALFLRFLLQFY